jgi:hypothetical protein
VPFSRSEQCPAFTPGTSVMVPLSIASGMSSLLARHFTPPGER